MVKPEWGTKRGCPKCGTRFYDLGNDEPVTCINCGYAWEPEPILKFEAAASVRGRQGGGGAGGRDRRRRSG